MAPQQKRTWIQLGIFVVLFPAWLVLALSGQQSEGGALRLDYGRHACLWVAVIGVVLEVGVSLAFRWQGSGGEVVADERDKAILRKSFVVASAASHVALVVGCLGVLVLSRRGGNLDLIPVDLLVAVVVAALAMWFFVYCITTLITYAREG